MVSTKMRPRQRVLVSALIAGTVAFFFAPVMRLQQVLALLGYSPRTFSLEFSPMLYHLAHGVSVLAIFFACLAVLAPQRAALDKNRKTAKEAQDDETGKRKLIEVPVASLRVYPIKSCAGVEISKGRLFERGLEFDREFGVMRPELSREAESPLRDLTPYELMTIRECGDLVKIQPQLPNMETMTMKICFFEHRNSQACSSGDGGLAGKDVSTSSSNKVGPTSASSTTSPKSSATFERTQLEDVDSFVLKIQTGDETQSGRLQSHQAQAADGERDMLLWDSLVRGIDQGDEAGAWLSKKLGRPGLRLVRFHQRDGHTDGKFKPPRFMPPPRFADGMPLLVGTTATLQTIGFATNRSADEVSRRFRFNIILDNTSPVSLEAFLKKDNGNSGKSRNRSTTSVGSTSAPRCRYDKWRNRLAFAEDAWKGARISEEQYVDDLLDQHQVREANLLFLKPCQRCPVPLVNPKSGHSDGAELYRVLKQKQKRTLEHLMTSHLEGEDPPRSRFATMLDAFLLKVLGFAEKTLSCAASSKEHRVKASSSSVDEDHLRTETQNLFYNRRLQPHSPLLAWIRMCVHNIVSKREEDAFTGYFRTRFSLDRMKNAGGLFVGNNAAVNFCINKVDSSEADSLQKENEREKPGPHAVQKFVWISTASPMLVHTT
ncbi:unnamed protein product [Amoebophrya sp. A25]|nr:unnamed protein product [Amoebophrya sp. A25]|eukprot:GSA25T00010009001.1